MSPFTDYTTHLFPLLPPSQITTLSCGHVIPSSNLLAWNLSRGSSGKEFNFTFKNRGDNEMVDELGRALLNICTIVPDGVVVFFPSYAYLSSILLRWEISPSQGDKTLLQRLEGKKSLFKESKDLSVDAILQDYAQAIDSGKGGLLFSVVGGKMSEGINFSDKLGRCVVIVGLPFPNIQSAEWKAKIEYIENATIERLSQAQPQPGPESPDGREGQKLTKEEIQRRAKEQGREFYENACMRAVNQSVGRAIRHKGDFAAIVMVDSRFSGERVRGKLPGWIRGGLVEGAGEKNFGALMGSLGAFFRGKKGS
jgi:chromosome transmission fidelity protein 1